MTIEADSKAASRDEVIGDAKPTLAQATAVWAHIGLLSFGGPAAQIALMHRLVVEERGWIDERRYLHALSYCMLLPGPEAQQLATYIGWLLHGMRGGLIAGTLFIVPGALVMLLLSTLYALYQEAALVEGLFFGVKAAVIAVVLQALLRIGRRVLSTRRSKTLALAAFAAIFLFDLPFPLVVALAALAGFAHARAHPEHYRIDGDTDPLAASRGSLAGALGRSLAIALIGVTLWFAPIVVAFVMLGEQSMLVDAGVFFSQLAVVTFGGAYAVLSYLAQQAVDVYGWLAPGEMADGLGLAESTPGPLIMVVQHVGFLGGFRNPGEFTSLTGGLLGAAMATWVTFVPCFMWIFLGAPYIERLRGSVGLSGALAAITAAVVGVIANLALWFAIHVLFATVRTERTMGLRLLVPDIASLDLAAAGLALLAGVALLRLRLGLITVLGACGLIGVAWRLVA